MSEIGLNAYKKALLYTHYAEPSDFSQVLDPFAQQVTQHVQSPTPKLNKIMLALLVVASAHLAIWYTAKHLPTPTLEMKKPDPVVIEIIKPEEPPKIIEPEIPPIVQKPKVPPITDKPKPVQKPIEQSKPIQKSVEPAKPVQKTAPQSTPQPVAEPVVAKTPSPAPIAKSIEPVSPAATNDGPVTEAKGYAGYLSNPAPDYPEQALDRGWEGSVILRVRVQPNGHPDEVNVKQSSGKKILDTAAVRTVKQWRFSPALKGKTPVEGWVDVPIHYRLPK